MPWKPGQSGNPEGARIKARRISTILDRALAQEDLKAEEDHRIRKGIEKMLDKISEGDLAAFQTIADRTEGKPAQQIDHGNANGEPFKIQFDSPDGDA